MELFQDLRYALRMFARNRGFSMTAVAALALGIGATSAIFSVLYGVLWKPLPYEAPDRLVRVYEENPVERFQNFPLSPANFLDYRQQNTVFESIATYVRQDQQFGSEHPERLVGVRVSYGFFHLFGAQPMLGRAFTREEEAAQGGTKAAIIGHHVWQRLYQDDPQIIGKEILLSGDPMRIVGVMPPDFEHVSGGYQLPRGEMVDIWLPLDMLGRPQGVPRAAHYANTIARLKPGISLDTAQAEMNIIARRLESQFPDDKNWRVRLQPLQEDLVGKAQPTLLVIGGAVAFLLMIACVNVSNLLLARAASRQWEISIRMAVGASRGRLIRQMLTESLLLAGLGGTLGFLLAIIGVRALIFFAPEGVPRLTSIGPDAQILIGTASITLLSVLLFGLVPALRASANTRLWNRPSGLFVIAQVALTVVLLIGAGLLLRSFAALGRVDPGFRPNGVLTINTTLSYTKLGGARRYANFYEDFVERLARLPGVTAVGSSLTLPWTGINNNGLFGIEGRVRDPNQDMHAYYQPVSSDYFRAIGVPLLAGRFLTPADHFDAPKVVLINRALALQYWPTVEASIGQRIYTLQDADSPNPPLTIVGVVGDVKDSPTDGQAQATFYESFLQSPTFNNYIAVRSNMDAATLVPLVRRIAEQVGNDLSIQEIRPMDDVVAASLSTQRFALQLVASFAIVALTLALIGIYGVVAYTVRHRVKEIAIRSALGAPAAATLRLVLGRGTLQIAIGMTVGSICALGLTRLLSSLLFEVSATDAATFAMAALLMTMIALAACLIPVRAALRVDPISVLRHD